MTSFGYTGQYKNGGFTEILVLVVDFHIRICRLIDECSIGIDIRHFSTEAAILF